VTRARARQVATLVTTAVVLSVIVRVFVVPASEEPFDEGPVVVLGGSPARVKAALTLLPEPTQERPLVVSHSAIMNLQRLGGSCEAPYVRCIRPEPASTWGEARAIGALAGDEGWEVVTVVTDEYHLARSRLLVRRCSPVPVRLVGSGKRTGTVGVPASMVLREVAATAVSAARYHDCSRPAGLEPSLGSQVGLPDHLRNGAEVEGRLQAQEDVR
jgi:hypothetical protein